MRLTTRPAWLLLSSLLFGSLAASVACTSLLGDFEVAAKSGAVDAGSNVPETAPPVEGGGGVDATAPDAGSTQFQASYIAAGVNHTCAVRPPGSVYCWGNNDLGQLGNPPSLTPGGKSNRPIKVANLGFGFGQGKPITKVWVGGNHSCALDADGSLFCWGGNEANQLNNGEAVDPLAHSEPKRVKGPNATQPLLGGVSSAALGVKHSCAVITNGDVVCWGYNVEGQTGDPQRTTGRPALKVPSVTNATRVTAANTHSCAVGSGQLWCWGLNSNGQVGPTGNGVVPPTAVPFAKTPFIPSAGSLHTCVTAGAPNELFCFGDNTVGQLGVDSGAGPAPVNVGPAPGQIDTIEVGGSTSCARGSAADSRLACWGSNTKGQLGRGTKDPDRHPDFVVLRDLAPLKEGEGAYSVGAEHACAIGKATDKSPAGGVFCWGSGAFGKLGVDAASTDDATTAKPVILPQQ